MANELKAWLRVALDLIAAVVICGLVNGSTDYTIDMGAFIGILALKTAYDLKFKGGAS